MAISFVAVGTTQQAVNTGTASISVTPTLPAGTAAGDRVFIVVANAPATTTPTTPAGWNLLQTASLGTGTLGATTGPRRLTVFWRDYDGAWSMPTVTLPSVAAPALLAQSVAVTKGASEVWALPLSNSGSDVTTTGTAYSATAATAVRPVFAAGDYVLAAMTGAGTAGMSGGAITQTGVTMGTVTERADWPSSGATNGVHAAIWDALASAGTGTAAPVNTGSMSLSGISAGGTIFVKQGLVATPGAGPQLVASYLVESQASDTSTLSTPTFTPATGEVLVCKVHQNSSNTVTVSGGGLAWTARATGTAANKAQCWVYTAVVPAGQGSMSVSSNPSSASSHGMVVERWSNASLAASPASVSTVGSSTAPSATLTSTVNDSISTWISTDWNVVATNVAVYPAGTVPEMETAYGTSHDAFAGFLANGTAGSETVGMTGPTNQNWQLVGIEVIPSDGGGASAAAPPAQNPYRRLLPILVR